MRHFCAHRGGLEDTNETVALTINTNVVSLFSRRSLERNTSALGLHFERLSTGFRINSAKDDAAGLAISERMTSQIRGKMRGFQNTNDAVSLAQTAEAGMQEVSNLLQRMRELAVQAANDTNTASDRALIQTEIDQLLAEIDRSATETTFNGRALLDGTYSGLFQVGANAGETISMAVGDIRTSNLGQIAHVTGNNTVVNFANPLVGAGPGIEASLTLNAVSVRATTVADDSVSVVLRASSAIAKAKAINEVSLETGVTATVNATTVTGAPVAGGIILNGQLRINNVNIGAVVVQAGDANGNLRNAINAVSAQTGVVASIDTSTNPDRIILTAEDGRNVFILAAFGATVASGLSFGTTFGTITLESDDAFSIAGANPEFAGFTRGIVGRDPLTASDKVDVTTQSKASTSIRYLDAAIRQLARERANVGAVSNRLESTLSSISGSVEQLSAARSRIQDTDVAAETTALIRRQILAASSTAVMAQANLTPGLALQLIRGQAA